MPGRAAHLTSGSAGYRGPWSASSPGGVAASANTATAHNRSPATPSTCVQGASVNTSSPAPAASPQAAVRAHRARCRRTRPGAPAGARARPARGRVAGVSVAPVAPAHPARHGRRDGVPGRVRLRRVESPPQEQREQQDERRDQHHGTAADRDRSGRPAWTGPRPPASRSCRAGTGAPAPPPSRPPPPRPPARPSAGPARTGTASTGQRGQPGGTGDADQRQRRSVVRSSPDPRITSSPARASAPDTTPGEQRPPPEARRRASGVAVAHRVGRQVRPPPGTRRTPRRAPRSAPTRVQPRGDLVAERVPTGTRPMAIAPTAVPSANGVSTDDSANRFSAGPRGVRARAARTRRRGR